MCAFLLSIHKLLNEVCSVLKHDGQFSHVEREKFIEVAHMNVNMMIRVLDYLVDHFMTNREDSNTHPFCCKIFEEINQK